MVQAALGVFGHSSHTQYFLPCMRQRMTCKRNATGTDVCKPLLSLVCEALAHSCPSSAKTRISYSNAAAISSCHWTTTCPAVAGLWTSLSRMQQDSWTSPCLACTIANKRKRGCRTAGNVCAQPVKLCFSSLQEVAVQGPGYNFNVKVCLCTQLMVMLYRRVTVNLHTSFAMDLSLHSCLARRSYTRPKNCFLPEASALAPTCEQR